MSTQDKIQKLTETLLKLSSNVTLSDAIDSDSDKNAGIAASPKAVSTLASVILDAAKNASEGSDGENEIYEPLLGEVKHEIGSWWFSIDGSIPVGGLPHLGHLVSRSTYGTGWTWIETNKTVVSDEEWLAYAESHNGTCPYYSYGDGSTTFRTPSYDQSFLKVLASINGTGSMEEAGLPNITGKFNIRAMDNGIETILHDTEDSLPGKGAFDVENTFTGRVVSAGIQRTSSVNLNTQTTSFNASYSNPIYNNSDTVTPQNYGIIVGIYLVGAVSAPIGETDAANLLNGISVLETGKASVDLSNLSTAGRSLASGLGMPSDRYVNLTLGASDTRYVAPANGYFASTATITGSGFGLLDLRYAETNKGCTAGASGEGRVVRVILPVLKDSVVSLLWNSSISVGSWVFIYANGDE